MNVTEAVLGRHSIRAFLDRPVELAAVREAVQLAARAPSGGNLQPWRVFVLAGEAMPRFTALAQERLRSNPDPDPLEHAVYPPGLGEPYRTHRIGTAEALYGLLGIDRKDKAARRAQFDRNFTFFGAPAAIFLYVDRRMGPPQWADLGMYLQTLMLLLKERGLDTCAQECWTALHRTVTNFLGAPQEWTLFTGLAIGHADPEAAVNRLVTERAPLEEWATFLGA
jgi:nitroreductase